MLRCGESISRDGAFLGLLRLIAGAFSERLRPQTGPAHEPAARPDRLPPDRLAERHHRHHAAILIGAEVFGAAFAGGWALAILFGLDDTGAHILQAVLFAIGVFIMVAFIRAAQRVEPFTRRA